MKGKGLLVVILSVYQCLYVYNKVKILIVQTKTLLLFRAAAIMMKTGTVVTLKVAKFAAGCHGLESLLSQHASELNSSKRNAFRHHFVFFFLHPFQLFVTK